MAASSRESRRRKIVERGADRLAFIQGRLNTLPAEPEAVPSPASVLPALDPPPSVSNQSTESVLAEERAALPAVPKPDPDADSGQTNAYKGRIVAESQSNAGEAVIRGSNPAPSDSGREITELLDSLEDQISLLSTIRIGQSSEPPLPRRHNPFTPKEVTSAISQSERTRLFCSLTIAILVVLSQTGFPLLQSGLIKSIISFGPLYLVLLTNISIVIAQLLLGKPQARERLGRRENGNASANGFGWAEQVGKTLELGLVVQKAFDAVFMDCSVFALILVCGLSFAY